MNESVVRYEVSSFEPHEHLDTDGYYITGRVHSGTRTVNASPSDLDELDDFPRSQVWGREKTADFINRSAENNYRLSEGRYVPEAYSSMLQIVEGRGFRFAVYKEGVVDLWTEVPSSQLPSGKIVAASEDRHTDEDVIDAAIAAGQSVSTQPPSGKNTAASADWPTDEDVADAVSAAIQPLQTPLRSGKRVANCDVWPGGEDLEDAVIAARELLATEKAAHGSDAPAVANALQDLAAVLTHLSRYDEAETLYRQSLMILERIYGHDQLKVTVAMAPLARLLVDLCYYDEAETLYRRMLAIMRDAYGPDHMKTLGFVGQLQWLTFAKAGKHLTAKPPKTRNVATMGDAK